LPVQLVKAVIWAESNFDPNAVSAAGAKGLMQLMDATAEALGVEDSFDPAQNIEGGTAYLRQLLDRYGRRVLEAAGMNEWEA
jgi:soluble lytic murein transglycosylase-like protein